jgi:two-component system chemotaxis response regulator CheY
MARKALIVDDSVCMRRMVSDTVEQMGFTTLQAGNGQQALEVLADQPIDLVITDLNMPEMDGLQLIRCLREQSTYQYIPILMLTTESQDAVKQRGRAAGATGWIVKPFNPERLQQLIARLVR